MPQLDQYFFRRNMATEWLVRERQGRPRRFEGLVIAVERSPHSGEKEMIELGQTGDSRRFAFFSGHLAQSFEKALFRDAGGPLADGIRIGNSESGDEGLPRDALAMDMLPEVVIILANPGGPQAVAHRVVTIGPVHHVFIRVERFPVGEKVVSPLLLHPCASKFARDLGPGILFAIFRAAYAVSTAEMGVQPESRESAAPAGTGFPEFDLELVAVEPGIAHGLPPTTDGDPRTDEPDQNPVR